MVNVINDTDPNAAKPKLVIPYAISIAPLTSTAETLNMDDPKENQPDEEGQVAAITNGKCGNDDPAEDRYESELGEWEGVDFPDYGDW